MTKLIIFDLDGVLIDSSELHFRALNQALASINERFVISEKENESVYDDLTTNKKLELLTELKGLSRSHYEKIWKDKQRLTFKALKEIPRCDKLIDIFQRLKNLDYTIAVASNSIRESIKLSLISLGIIEYVDYYVSNQDVKRPKPSPEMYWKCMIELNALPKDTIIIEDNPVSQKGVINSGARLLAVKNTDEVTWENITRAINDQGSNSSQKLNVLIPMAGLGNRFQQKGYTVPKPLIDVNGTPMIVKAINSLNFPLATYHFVISKNQYTEQIKNLLSGIVSSKFIEIDYVTEGPACSALLFEPEINNGDELIIANCDQVMEWNSDLFLLNSRQYDGSVLTYHETTDKNSYAKLDERGYVREIKEKEVISNVSLAGIHYWKQGRYFVDSSRRMIAKDDRAPNGEFYVGPTYNYMINQGLTVGIYHIPNQQHHPVGVPDDLIKYIDYENSKIK